MTPLLSDEERAAIERAVHEAESASGAEIVPVLVAASASYAVADWRGVGSGALLGALAHFAAPFLAPGEAAQGWLGTAAVAVAALAGFGIARVDRFRRALAADELDRCVDQAAAAQFLRHQVFRTRDRTGILLYISLFEHRVRVLGDEGIYAAVPRTLWNELAAELATEIRRTSPAGALLAAVSRAGALVREHGPLRRPADSNELSNLPVT